jgi:hypothetical protein
MRSRPDPRLPIDPAWSRQPLYVAPTTRRWMPPVSHITPLNPAFWLLRASRRGSRLPLRLGR